MRTETRTLFIVVAIATGLFVTGAAAQHDGHNNQTSPQADSADSAKTGDMPGMHRMMRRASSSISSQRASRQSRRRRIRPGSGKNSPSTASSSRNCSQQSMPNPAGWSLTEWR